MKRVLVVYDSGYGATAEAAGILGRELREAGAETNVRQVSDVDEGAECDAVIAGSPIRVGRCTPGMKRWLKRTREGLTRRPVAFFFTCMSVIRTGPSPDFPVRIDPAFDLPRGPEKRMSLMEKGHTSEYYLDRFLGHVPQIRPLSIAFFKGNLHLGKLAWRHRMIMRLAMYLMPEIRPGDYLNEEEVKAWARSVASDIRV
jgi:menaquinone-dependent protoporphyrinogen oxidase